MNWYMAKLIFRINCGEGNHTPQFDEQLRLISAETESEAFEKSLVVGEEGQFSFLNQKDETVRWEFINTSELYGLGQLTHGAEMYSRVCEADHAFHFIDTVNKKADQIKLSILEKQAETV